MTDRQKLLIEWIESWPKEPLKYQQTQPQDTQKAKRTLQWSWSVFLAERRGEA